MQPVDILEYLRKTTCSIFPVYVPSTVTQTYMFMFSPYVGCMLGVLMFLTETNREEEKPPQ
jgi:hypothetical protein